MSYIFFPLSLYFLVLEVLLYPHYFLHFQTSSSVFIIVDKLTCETFDTVESQLFNLICTRVDSDKQNVWKTENKINILVNI